MFTGLAGLIARRHKLIIIAWVVATLVALPLVPLASDVVQYEETSMAPRTLESSIANDYISSSFGSIAGQPTTIIVLTSDDVTDEAVKRAVMSIENDIANASLYGDISKVKVTSVYSITESYALNIIRSLNYAWNGANLSAYLIFGTPQEYRELWLQTNWTASALSGVPDRYADIWAMTAASNPSLTLLQVDEITYSELRSQLEAESSGIDKPQKDMLLGWFQAFAEGWNGTAESGGSPDERAAAAHSAAFANYLDEHDLAGQDESFLTRVNEWFTSRTVDFTNVSELSRQIADGNIEQAISKMSSGQATYNNASSGQAALVRQYMGSFYAWWNDHGSVPSVQSLEAGLMNISLQLGEGIEDQDTRDVFLGVRSAIGGLSNYNDRSVRSEKIIDLVASMPSVVSRVAPERWLVAAAGTMGQFDLGKAVALSHTIVANSSLYDLPFLMPGEVIRQVVSEDRSAMLISLTYEEVEGDLHPGRECVGMVRAIVTEAVSGTELKHYVTGTDALNTDMESSTMEDLRIIEPMTIVLVLVLIGIFFRSFVASSIPPLSVGVALGISYAAVYLIGTYILEVHYAVLTLLLTATIGAGCDYCIFILSRYREERRNGRSKEESVKQAVMWAGESILISGITVIIGFGVLAIGEFSLFKSLGIVLSLGIAVALLVALTLLPSVLFLLGDRTFWPAKMSRAVRERSTPSYFTRSAKFSIKHARALVIAAIIISAPATYLTLTVDTSYDYISSMADTESKQGLGAIDEGFGGGKVTPTQIAVEMTSAVTAGDSLELGALRSIENLSEAIAGLENVDLVIGPTRPFGTAVDISNASLMDGYRSITDRMVSEDRKAVLLTVIFEAEPFDMRSIGSIEDIRSIGAGFEDKDGVARVLVGGATASMSDIAVMNQADFEKMAVLAIVSIYLVLMVVMGSMVSPLRSILTILLSISWTMAVGLLLFQGLLGQPILYMAPMILLLVCLGLGMDYDILLTTRVREDVARGMGNDEAIVHAVERTGGIITACGVIMASAFGSMMLSSGYLLREFGFVLMFAILLDATVVRIYLVPAAMSLLGRWNWWAPGALRRLNERRDIERLAALRDHESGK